MEERGVKADEYCFSSAIDVCFNNAKYGEALRLVRLSQAEGYYPSFSVHDGSRKLDLHGFPLASACMLLSDALLAAIVSEKSKGFQDIVVITGKGRGSGTEGPVLQSGVPDFLHKILKLATTAVQDNEGRLLLNSISLQQWTESFLSGDSKHHVAEVLVKPYESWTPDECDKIDRALYTKTTIPTSPDGDM